MREAAMQSTLWLSISHVQKPILHLTEKLAIQPLVSRSLYMGSILTTLAKMLPQGISTNRFILCSRTHPTRRAYACNLPHPQARAREALSPPQRTSPLQLLLTPPPRASPPMALSLMARSVWSATTMTVLRPSSLDNTKCCE